MSTQKRLLLLLGGLVVVAALAGYYFSTDSTQIFSREKVYSDIPISITKHYDLEEATKSGIAVDVEINAPEALYYGLRCGVYDKEGDNSYKNRGMFFPISHGNPTVETDDNANILLRKGPQTVRADFAVGRAIAPPKEQLIECYIQGASTGTNGKLSKVYSTKPGREMRKVGEDVYELAESNPVVNDSNQTLYKLNTIYIIPPCKLTPDEILYKYGQPGYEC